MRLIVKFVPKIKLLSNHSPVVYLRVNVVDSNTSLKSEYALEEHVDRIKNHRIYIVYPEYQDKRNGRNQAYQ
jgi:hypothetical protein